MSANTRVSLGPTLIQSMFPPVLSQLDTRFVRPFLIWEMLFGKNSIICFVSFAFFQLMIDRTIRLNNVTLRFWCSDLCEVYTTKPLGRNSESSADERGFMQIMSSHSLSICVIRLSCGLVACRRGGACQLLNGSPQGAPLVVVGDEYPMLAQAVCI